MSVKRKPPKGIPKSIKLTPKNNLNYKKIQKHRKPSRAKKILYVILIIEIILVVSFLIYMRFFVQKNDEGAPNLVFGGSQKSTQAPSTGKILLADTPQSYNVEQTNALIRETNHHFDTPVNTGIQKQLVRYTSSDGKSNNVGVYGRVYWPENKGNSRLPVLAFGPGTTGLGEACAASLEKPAVKNWANYDSLMAAYASQGYIVIITDYEGMRDESRIHHYMVGELEGRAVLDGIRAVRNLETTKNNIDSDELFVGGYSQGGHAAFWADQIAASYAPDLKLEGAIGFGPVTSVNETLTDAITSNANINWFGPFVLVSYQDWYRRTYPVDKILLPQWSKNLKTDVLRECIDSVNKYWPNNLSGNKAASIYTSEFIAAAKTGNIANNQSYKTFMTDMLKNIVGDVKTTTPKLINQGLHDNVVLPKQSRGGNARFCKSNNVVTFREYDKSPYAVQSYNPAGLVDHYQTMNAAFKDTLVWMQALATGSAPQNTCK